MLPKYGDDIKRDFTRMPRPSRTFKLNTDETIRGEIDGLEAVRQAIFLILNTERYKHEIYSWNYGAELEDLIGKPVPLVYSMIKQRICEALIQDDRIQSVDNFSFERDRDKVAVTFAVETIHGNIEVSKEVPI